MSMGMSMIYLKSLTQDVVTQIIRAGGSCIKCTTICLTYVDFREGEKPEYLEKNPRSTGEFNYKELTHMIRKPDLVWLCQW